MLTDYYEPYQFSDPGPELDTTEGDWETETQSNVSPTEWAQSPIVRRVLEVVGPPDGTLDWRLRFAEELFGFTEALATAKSRLRCSLDELEQLREAATIKTNAKGMYGEGSYAQFLIGSGLSIAESARYLGIEPLDIAQQVCPSNPEGILKAESLILEGRLTYDEIAKRCKVNRWAIYTHAQRLGDNKRSGQPTTSAEQARCIELRESGLTYKQVAAIIAEEFNHPKFCASMACRLYAKAKTAA